MSEQSEKNHPCSSKRAKDAFKPTDVTKGHLKLSGLYALLKAAYARVVAVTAKVLSPRLTSSRRPMSSGKIAAQKAFIFSISFSLLGFCAESLEYAECLLQPTAT